MNKIQEKNTVISVANEGMQTTRGGTSKGEKTQHTPSYPRSIALLLKRNA